MRRFIIAILCCLLLTTTVSAAGSVDDLQSTTLISSSGSCEVTLTMTITVDTVPARLDFPLPKDARDISVNGGSAHTTLSDNLRLVDLTNAVSAAGTHTIVLHYDLPDAVREEKEQLVLTVELLAALGVAWDLVWPEIDKLLAGLLPG